MYIVYYFEKTRPPARELYDDTNSIEKGPRPRRNVFVDDLFEYKAQLVCGRMMQKYVSGLHKPCTPYSEGSASTPIRTVGCGFNLCTHNFSSQFSTKNIVCSTTACGIGESRSLG